MKNFQMKKYANFLMFAQNIDREYMLEPPHCGGSKDYPGSICFRAKIRKNVYPCTPQFYYVKVGCEGVLYVLHGCVMIKGKAL